jgi:hypothetical protein
LRRFLKRLIRIVLICVSLLLLLIVVEVIAGWRCPLQADIPSPVPQPKERQAAVSGIKDYGRPEDDTYLSIPEWYIVWSYQEKADFQERNLPSAFPYFAAVRQYWGNYCCIRHLTHGKYAFNAGEHIMLAVIGTSFSAEYILKGIYEETIGRLAEWTSGHQFTEEDSYAYRVARDYAEFVHVRPFYEYHFAPRVKGLWAENPFWGKHFVRKWERRVFLTLDYSVEAFYCWLIEKATHASYGFEPDRTYAWLENADATALSRLAGIKVLRELRPRTYILDAPRYQPFTDVAAALATSGGHFVEISGNSSIAVSLLAPSWSAEIQSPPRLYSMPMLTRPGWQRVTIRCDVTSLDGVLNNLPTKSVAIEHIYDY